MAVGVIRVQARTGEGGEGVGGPSDGLCRVQGRTLMRGRAGQAEVVRI